MGEISGGAMGVPSAVGMVRVRVRVRVRVTGNLTLTPTPNPYPNPNPNSNPGPGPGAMGMASAVGTMVAADALEGLSSTKAAAVGAAGSMPGKASVLS